MALHYWPDESRICSRCGQVYDLDEASEDNLCPTCTPLCSGCGGVVSEGRGVYYAGKQYHRRGECIPPDLTICDACGELEDTRRIEDGKCEPCRAAERKEVSETA